jgi:hypothetical protein
VNITRKPLLLIAVNGGMTNRNQFIIKNVFRNFYCFCWFVFHYRKVNLRVDLIDVGGWTQDYDHLFEQAHREFLINRPETSTNSIKFKRKRLFTTGSFVVT